MPKRIKTTIAADSLCPNCPVCEEKGKSDCAKAPFSGLKCRKNHFWRWCPSCKTISVRTVVTLKKEYAEKHGEPCPRTSKLWWQMTQLCHNKDCRIYMKHWDGKI